MVYLRGSGQQADPYIIHNAAALKYWFENNQSASDYSVVVNNIDMFGVTINIPHNTQLRRNLDGYGFTIFNLNISGGPYCYHRTTWKRLRFKQLFATCSLLLGYNNSESIMTDIIFDGIDVQDDYGIYGTYTRVIFSNLANAMVSSQIPQSGFLIDSGYSLSKFTDLRGLSNKYDSSNYPGINALPGLWLLDGSSAPRLIPQPVTFFTQAYVVKGVTKVAGQSKSRRCRAHAVVDFNEIANVVSASDGTYLLNCGYYDDQVYVTHSDDYGRKLMVSKAYSLGEYVHPTTPNGYRYKCTTAGTSAATQPPEPWPTSSNLVSGTAIFTPEPVYKAETFLVVPKLYDFITGQPV